MSHFIRQRTLTYSHADLKAKGACTIVEEGYHKNYPWPYDTCRNDNKDNSFLLLAVYKYIEYYSFSPFPACVGGVHE
jgi:hypothetical protein